MKIQHITVTAPDSLSPSIQLTIADAPVVDDSAVWLTACVTIDREGVSLENIELCALDKILDLVASAKTAVNATTDAVRGR